MDSPPLLSICIPTRDRADLLRDLLESIVAQWSTGVEIVISDDGSTDHTGAVVESYRGRFYGLIYERADPPLRYDRNVLNVVRLARGKFCWLFSDDDRMEPGALSTVLEEIRGDVDLTGLTTGRISYDYSLVRRLPVRDFKVNVHTTFIDAGTTYLALLDRIGFLSCQVINRGVWGEIVAITGDLKKYFTGYVQLYVILRMMKKNPRWRFVAKECVAFRADNDSFRALGTTGRLRMDVCGYETITGDVFGRDSSIYHEAMSEVARTHARHHIIDVKRRGASLSFSTEALALCVRHYWKYPAFWFGTFPVLILPAGFMLAIRRFYQRVRT